MTIFLFLKLIREVGNHDIVKIIYIQKYKSSFDHNKILAVFLSLLFYLIELIVSIINIYVCIYIYQNHTYWSMKFSNSHTM